MEHGIGIATDCRWQLSILRVILLSYIVEWHIGVFQIAMALPFEAMAQEELQRDRLAALRRREAWAKGNEVQRLLHAHAELIMQTKELMEDLVIEVQPEAVVYPGKQRAVDRLRASITDSATAYKKIEACIKYGVDGAEEIFDRLAEVDGLTPDEERHVKELLRR